MNLRRVHAVSVVLLLTFLYLGQLQAFTFKTGDQIQIFGGTFNVRQTPAGTVLGTQAAGSVGTVIGGPTVASLSGTSFTWYDINFAAGVDGWVSDTGLAVGLNYGTNFVNGYDVYSGNGAITFGPSVAAGQTFVYAKATEGATFNDTRFATYMPAAKAAGLLVGAYHFAHPLNNPGTNGAVAEAQHFLSRARAFVTNGWMPPALDVEDEPFGTNSMDTCSDGTDSAGTSLNLVCKLGQAQLSAWVRAWVNEVKRQTGVTPILYMNRDYSENGMEADLAACPLWLAYFETPPDLTPNAFGPWSNSWTFLQYSFTNSLTGVTDPTVDFNKFSGDIRALKLFAAQSVTTNILTVLSGIGGGRLTPPTNGQFQFEVSSAAQTLVTVQSSTNLLVWTNLGTATISHGHATFTDTNLQSRKFYRPHP